MDNPKHQLAQRIQEANNVLITVSTNPSVDQLAAAIGLTLMLNKLKKHATAVFSGEVPSTIEFLSPDETIETNTDSLRDFIISLDKNKADKIRYKVEDRMVKIFITPYKSSIGEDDLIFSQGDFNVDVVVALGVQTRDDLDQAITAHGRILHDATVTTINTDDSSEMGSINWIDPEASSLCEMVVGLSDLIKENSLDEQMATALLTGIIAETDRFSNEKTTSITMNMSAKLMAAGANQQLVVTKLEAPVEPPKPENNSESEEEVDLPEATIAEDGSLHIEHLNDDQAEANDDLKEAPADLEMSELPEPSDEPQADNQTDQSQPAAVTEQSDDQPADDQKNNHRSFVDTPTRPIISEARPTGDSSRIQSPADLKFVSQPPSTGGPLSAAADRVTGEESVLKTPHIDNRPLLDHEKPALEAIKNDNPDNPEAVDQVKAEAATEATNQEQSSPAAPQPDNRTLEDIEAAVSSPHQAEADNTQAPANQGDQPKDEATPPSNPIDDQPASEPATEPANIDEIRSQVDNAINTAQEEPTKPIEALGADGRLDVPHEEGSASDAQPAADSEADPSKDTPNIHIDTEGTISYPENLIDKNRPMPQDETAAPGTSAGSPPPVPPPLMPPPNS